MTQCQTADSAVAPADLSSFPHPALPGAAAMSTAATLPAQAFCSPAHLPDHPWNSPSGSSAISGYGEWHQGPLPGTPPPNRRGEPTKEPHMLGWLANHLWAEGQCSY